MISTRYCVFNRIGGAVVLGLLVVLATGCDGTIHKEANIGGIDTLSIDAKQRLMVVADRDSADGAAQRRVACTEPSPDSLVARAAAIAANASVNTGTGGGSGGGAFGAGFSESAASIAFRDHTVQMLRDGYYRLCEAYMNGGLSETKYKLMVMNADTFMVVAAALQTLGNNPVAPPVAVSAGDITANAGTGDASVTVSGAKVAIGSDGQPTELSLAFRSASDPKYQISAENAQAAYDIINDYLRYRLMLSRDMRRIERADAKRAATTVGHPRTSVAER